MGVITRFMPQTVEDYELKGVEHRRWRLNLLNADKGDQIYNVAESGKEDDESD